MTNMRGLLVALSLAIVGCSSDGHFTLLGYTTAPPFDRSIRTVYVPIFGNRTFRRGIEFELTKAVIREIESKSPYKVVSDRSQADAELTGTIVSRRKSVININQLGETREAELGFGVEVTWRDLRSGVDLHGTNPHRDPTQPTPPALILPTGAYIPELGGSTASAEDQVVRQLARQVVHMMETWHGR